MTRRADVKKARQGAPVNKRVTARHLTRLSLLKSDFTPAATRDKLDLITTLGKLRTTEVGQLIQFHELLCFMQAYPNNRAILTEVNRALRGFAGLVEQAGKHQSASKLARLDNTGIVGTTIRYPFSFHTARWLYRHYPDDITIAWDDFDQQSVLLELLPALTSPFEAPALDDVDLETESWVKYAASMEGKTDFEWVVDKMVHAGMPEQNVEAIYELMDIPINWTLHPQTASRTLARVPLTRPVYQKRALDRKSIDTRQHVRSPIDTPRRVTEDRGRKLIADSIIMLAVRCREIYPLFYANPKDVMVIELDRAFTLIFIGMKPLRRFALESEYFFLGLKNNIPITYGSSTLCFDQAEVATNVFSSFRQGESALGYAQLMRALHQVFGTRAFLVQKFQIGYDDNDDAIKSGAFWFYHKLGFRPVDPTIAALAEREDKKRRQKSDYRSRTRVLKKLATSDMRYFVTGTTTLADKLCLSGLALLMSGYLGTVSDSAKAARSRTQSRATRDVCRILRIDDLSRWPQPERFWFKQFSPLVAHIPGLSKWTKSEREDLVSLIRAKGKPSEVEYVRLWNTHKRFQRALCNLSKKGHKIRAQLIESAS